MSTPKKHRTESTGGIPLSPEAKLGGSGPSSGKLVGCANFKRHNPKSDRFKIIDFDHLELWTTDATSAARRFAAGFGMQMVAGTDVNNGNLKYSSYCLLSNDIRFVITAPYWSEAPPTTNSKFYDSFPAFNRDTALQFVQKHGLAGRAIGIKVENATAAYERSVANGGTGVLPPVKITDENGTITYSEVLLYQDVVLRFVEGRDSYKGKFIPGYVDSGRPELNYGLLRIDHIVSNVPCLTDVTEHLIKMLGFHEFGEFIAEDVGTVDSGLNSMIVANNDEMVLMPVNEPTFGTRRKSQIQSFLEHNAGPGVQHIALQTKDILSTVKMMLQQSNWGGVEFLGNPGASYYNDHVPKKMGNLVDQKLIDDCAKYNILIDRDEEGGLLQIFTKPLPDRPTLFVEVIQRIGCPMPNGRQKPACGGFGKGNFGALFKSIEDLEKKRDGELPYM